MLNTNPIVPRDVPKMLKSCHDLGFSAMLWGEPGVGKTKMVEAYAKGLPSGLRDIRLTQIESVDLRGLTIPDLEAKLTRFLPPEFLPAEDAPAGVLFFDELNRAEPRLQASAFSILLERRIGERKIPDSWLICAAANGVEHSDQVYTIDPALADRFVHYAVEPDIESWIEWGQAAGIAADVMAFLRVRPDFLSKCEERISKGHIIGPSPRGWERVSQVIGYTKDKFTRETMIAGIVGRETAAEFFSVLEELEGMVEIKEILKASTKERLKMLPQSVPGLYRLCYALPAYAKDFDSGMASLGLLNDLNAFAETNLTLPVAEIKVLMGELLFDKYGKLGLEGKIAATPEYQTYEKDRAAHIAAAAHG